MSKLYRIFVHGRGSVLLWRRYDTLRTFVLVDYVMFAHNDQQMAMLKGRILKVTHQGTAPVQERRLKSMIALSVGSWTSTY